MNSLSSGETFEGNSSIPLGIITNSQGETQTIDKNKQISIINYKNGDIYEGEINEYYQPENLGLYKFENNSVYKGYFHNNNFHGFGCFYFCNGEIYQGFFENGLKHGFGKYFYDKNVIFTGYFEKNLQNGDGFISDSLKQSCFYGKWVQGLKEGACLFVKESEKILLFYEKNVLKSIKKL